MFASSYPLLDIFLTTLWIFAFVIFIFLIFQIMFDIFRSHDLSGFAKALWVIFIIFLPFLGILIYLIARGGSMAARNMKYQAEQQAQFDQYVRDVVAKTPPQQTPPSS
jgi:hypothetical protein